MNHRLRRPSLRHGVASLATGFLLAACSTNSAFLPDRPSPAFEQGPDVSEARNPQGDLLVCDAAPEPGGLPTAAWERTRSGIAAGTGEPRHAANDALMRADSSAVVRAKFTYGLVHWDLAHEPVELWIDDCSGELRRVTDGRTDSDGRARFRLNAGDVPSTGSFRLLFRVVGDNSFTEATLRVLPRGTKFVIFDIDETISAEGVRGTLQDAFTSDDDERVRKGAPEVTRLRRFEQGYQIIYLTGRNYALTELTRRWLAENGFAPGTLLHTQELRAKWPGVSGVGEFKLRQLQELAVAGFEVVFGYGNASTDWHAYREAGLPPERILMLGDGGAPDFGTHLREIRREGPAEQPFDY